MTWKSKSQITTMRKLYYSNEQFFINVILLSNHFSNMVLYPFPLMILLNEKLVKKTDFESWIADLLSEEKLERPQLKTELPA